MSRHKAREGGPAFRIDVREIRVFGHLLPGGVFNQMKIREALLEFVEKGHHVRSQGRVEPAAHQRVELAGDDDELLAAVSAVLREAGKGRFLEGVAALARNESAHLAAASGLSPLVSA